MSRFAFGFTPAYGSAVAPSARLVFARMKARDCPHMKLPDMVHPADARVCHVVATDVEQFRRDYPDEVVIL